MIYIFYDIKCLYMELKLGVKRWQNRRKLLRRDRKNAKLDMIVKQKVGKYG